LVSPDGDEGFPGLLTLNVSYTLEGSELSIHYRATTDKATPINITNHSYFNLGGHQDWKDLSQHQIQIAADKYLPADENNLVTGEIKRVEGTVYNLQKPFVMVEKELNKVPGGGFDHTFCFGAKENSFSTLSSAKSTAAPECSVEKDVVVVTHLGNGRVMKVDTNQNGVQFYTANYLNGQGGKSGIRYNRHTAFCLETQNYPDAINNKNFPSCVLRPNGEYNHKTSFKFSCNA